MPQNLGAIPPGWIGGFAQSNPAFAYPNPNLTSLPLLGNMDNIKLLQRQTGGVLARVQLGASAGRREIPDTPPLQREYAVGCLRPPEFPAETRALVRNALLVLHLPTR
jgi:hypothetical protein